jgi:6-phosphofructokinase 1
MRIAIITSGGDSPGMNPCIAGIVKNALALGHEVCAFEYGFVGIHENRMKPLGLDDVHGIYKMGGTVIKTGRLPELKEPQVQQELIRVLHSHGIGALIVLGGDGSFKGAEALHASDPTISYIGIPCTIDNNIYKSDYTLGFDTALNKQMAYIDDIMDTALSLPGRVFFVETLGAWDGYLAMSSTLMGMADYSVLVERPVSDDEIADIVAAGLKEKRFSLITFAEGTYRMFDTAEHVKKKLGCSIKCNLLGYQQRGGVPTATERLHAAAFAKYAVEAVDGGITNKYIAYQNGSYVYVDLKEAVNKKKFNWYSL